MNFSAMPCARRGGFISKNIDAITIAPSSATRNDNAPSVEKRSAGSHDPARLPSASLVAERFDRIEPRRFARGIQAKHHAHDPAENHGGDDDLRLHQHRPFELLGDLLR